MPEILATKISDMNESKVGELLVAHHPPGVVADIEVRAGSPGKVKKPDVAWGTKIDQPVKVGKIGGVT